MYVILTPDALDCPEAYPDWCGLSWFRNYRHIAGTELVETHYHDLPEIYLWHEGEAEAMIDGQPVPMRYGVMAYTAAGALHSITPTGIHSNTGIMPKAFPGCRKGHLHTDKTGESPKPQMPSFCMTSAENPFATPLELPRHCFARQIACAHFAGAQTILKRTTESWLGLLVREGEISIRVDGHVVKVSENHLFIVSQNIKLDVSSIINSEVAMVEGWPAKTPQ